MVIAIAKFAVGGFETRIGCPEFVVGGSQHGVAVLDVQDSCDSCDVDASIDKAGDPAQPFQIVGAVSTGSALGARRVEQSVALPEPQRLGSCSGQFGGHGDSVDALVGGRRTGGLVGHFRTFVQEISLRHLHDPTRSAIPNMCRLA